MTLKPECYGVGAKKLWSSFPRVMDLECQSSGVGV